MPGRVAYGRVILKLSGGALAGAGGSALDPDRVAYVAGEVAAARAAGTQPGVVIGGGNVVRGREAGALGWPQTTVDYMGMLATVVNALALREALAARRVPAEVLSAFGVGECCARYSRERAMASLAEGKVVVFAGGTGRPFFSTDTAAALRACELGAEAVLKATDVAGVFDRDPRGDESARPYETLAYNDVIGRDLAVMDAAAAALCRDHRIPIIVFYLNTPGNIVKILRGEKVGTFVG